MMLTYSWVHLVRTLRHYRAGVGVTGALAYLAARPFRYTPTYARRVEGVRHPVTVRLGTTDVSVLRQVLLEQHYAVPLPFTPTRIIDAGANIGLSAVFFANRYPDAEIIAIEPDASNFRLVQQNTAPYPKIRAIQAALAPHDGESVVIDPGLGHHGFQTAAHGTGPRVPALSVASVMRHASWTHVDVLKLDIEGAERDVFATSHLWIDWVRCCMVELHDHLTPGCAEAFDRATATLAERMTRGEIHVRWR